MLYIGIDVHKKLCNACIKDREGNVLKEQIFPNKSHGIDTLLKTIDDKKAKAVIESTANLWLRLYTALEEAGINVILANPKKTRAIAEARLKNDKVDASTLADLLRADLVAPCYVPPKRIRELRSLVRHRMNLVKDRTKVKNRIHALLDKYELEGFSSADQFGKKGMKWLKSLEDELSRIDRFVLDSDIRQIEMLNQLIDEVEVSIAEESVDNEDVRLLMTIPGVDYYTAMLFTNEIGDITRFSSAAKLVSWLGLAPRVHQSGSTSYNGRITKEGSPRVRCNLVQSARVAVRWDNHFKGKYQRIKARRGDGKAVVAVAREMVVAMYHMLTRREVYRFSSEAFVRGKYKRLERRVGNADKIRKRTPIGALP